MSDTKTSESAKIASTAKNGGAMSFATARRALTIGGVALALLNLTATMSGVLRSASPSVPPLLWGLAAVCFLASFILYLFEPSTRHEALAGPTDRRPTEASAAKIRPEEKSSARTESPVDDAGASEPAPAPLVRRGNPLRIVRGGGTALLGCFLAFLLMARQGHARWGVPLGAVFIAAAAWGVMDLMGTFDDPDDRVASSVTLRSLTAPLVSFVFTSLLFFATLGLATAGRGLPQGAWGILVTLTFAGGVATLFEVGRKLGAWATDEEGRERPLWKRHGFWVVVASAALFFPCMGSYALWDPWETHYGEVAREMLARDDWISLWWAQDGWFWSKPVLDMWMQAIAMATLGVHYMPDKMLIGDGTRPVMHPEWAVRAPVVLLAIVSIYLLYKGVARTFGRRAALLGSLVLATMPDWYMIGHQTMTDMPFVAAMTASMGLVLLGLRTEEHREARCYEVKVGAVRLRVSGWHLVFGAVLVCALPQIVYLLSRNIELVWRPGGAHGFRPHWDEFRSGSGGGNCGLPGNEDCRATASASIPHSTGANPEGFGPVLWRTVGAFEPGLQALLWAALLGVLLYMSWGERRVRRLYYLAAWFFAAISTLGKGPAGFGLPMLVTLLYLAGSRPSEGMFTRVRRIVHELTQFEIGSGLLLIVPIVALPWYIAMYVRHGAPFTDRLIFHDMFNRAFQHVHDTNEGDDTSFRFYVWQLGYALFPWTALAPLGLLWWLRRSDSKANSERSDASVLLSMWFVLGFALFSYMGTKFHHYIFPAVPPVAMLIGIVLDDMIGPRALAKRGKLAAYLAGITAAATLLVVGVSDMEPGSFFGIKPGGRLGEPSMLWGVVLAAAGIGVGAACVRLFGCKEGPSTELASDNGPPADNDERAHVSRMLAAGFDCRGTRARARRARPHHQAGERRPARRDSSAASIHVQLPSALARLARLLRSSYGVRRACRRAVVRARGTSNSPARRDGRVRTCVRLGALGPRRIHDGDCASLGPARGHCRVLRRSRVPR